MTATERMPTSNIGAAPFRSILRAEVRRIASRRSIRLLLAAAFLGVLSYSIFQLMSHANLNAHVLALNNAKLHAYEAQIRAACLRSQPPGAPVLPGTCVIPVPPTAVPGVMVAFAARVGLMGGATVIGGVGMLLGLLIGASYIGGDFESRVISLEVALEPRRYRVFFAKLLVLASFLVLTGILLELLWLGLGSIVASMAGNFNGFGAPQLRALLEVQLRIVAVMALLGMTSFALTVVVRNTAASVGIVLVYLMIGESILRVVLASVSAHLLSASIGAIQSVGGIEVATRRFTGASSSVISGPIARFGGASSKIFTHVSPMEGLFTVLIYAAILIVTSGWVFQKRDIF